METKGKTLIPVPTQSVGWCIGKQGRFIKYVERRSQARIIFLQGRSKTYDGQEWTLCIVMGTFRSILTAHRLLIERLVKFPTETKTSA